MAAVSLKICTGPEEIGSDQRSLAVFRAHRQSGASSLVGLGRFSRIDRQRTEGWMKRRSSYRRGICSLAVAQSRFTEALDSKRVLRSMLRRIT